MNGLSRPPGSDRLIVWHRALDSEREDDVEALSSWTSIARSRLTAAGGEIVTVVGTSVVVSFDTDDQVAAMEACLSLVNEAESLLQPVGGIPIVIGIEISEVVSAPRPVGLAFDRAQLFANRGRAGDIILGPYACARADGFLFTRRVGVGPSALRGRALDRRFPRRAWVRRDIERLGVPSVPAMTKKALAPMRALAERSTGVDVVAVRGPIGSGGRDYIRELSSELQPSLVLPITGVPGGLEPLGSLRLCLLSRWVNPEAIAAEFGPRSGETLSRIAVGEAVPRAEVVEAMEQLLSHFRGRRPWIVLDPIRSIDSATLEVLAAATQSAGDAFVIMRIRDQEELPPMLPPTRELTLPRLTPEAALDLAREVVGDAEAATFVAALGGASQLGVIEAARTLVASAELVFREQGGFEWRNRPRRATRSAPLESLLSERLAGLEDGPMRLLEAVCVAPHGSPRLLVSAVAALDGLDAEQRRESTATLRREALAVPGSTLSPTSEALRQLVSERMAPARLAELHRYLGAAMARSSTHRGPLVLATVGHYLGLGGEAKKSAQAMLSAAQEALNAGHPRAAVRLAARAVEVHAEQETRDLAAEISGRAAGSTPSEVGKISERAIAALLRGDLQEVERCIETAIADGRDLNAADRLRAMLCLARGELDDAMRVFRRVRDGATSDPSQRARASLTHAWILLHGGDAGRAVRAGMQALAYARAVRDPRGEAAALHTLSACFRALGRPQDADRLHEASPA